MGFFALPYFRTLVSPTLPDGSVDSRPYHKRGWPLFQLTVAAFAGTVIFDDQAVCDLFVESFFMRALQGKTFSNGKEDRPLVARLFKQLLYNRAGQGHSLM